MAAVPRVRETVRFRSVGGPGGTRFNDPDLEKFGCDVVRATGATFCRERAMPPRPGTEGPRLAGRSTRGVPGTTGADRSRAGWDIAPGWQLDSLLGRPVPERGSDFARVAVVRFLRRNGLSSRQRVTDETAGRGPRRGRAIEEPTGGVSPQGPYRGLRPRRGLPRALHVLRRCEPRLAEERGGRRKRARGCATLCLRPIMFAATRPGWPSSSAPVVGSTGGLPGPGRVLSGVEAKILDAARPRLDLPPGLRDGHAEAADGLDLVLIADHQFSRRTRPGSSGAAANRP